MDGAVNERPVAMTRLRAYHRPVRPAVTMRRFLILG
jgi:hypothetical protein